MYPGLDGALSILLIFPVTFFAAHLAGALPLLKGRTQRIFFGILMGFCAVLTAFDASLGLITLLLILAYGIGCGIHIFLRGIGPKRFLIGASAIVIVVLCALDYLLSVTLLGSRLAANEAATVGALRQLSSAEESIALTALKNSASESAYETIQDLRKNRLIYSDVAAGKAHSGYIFGENVEPAKKQFLFYAIPAHFPDENNGPRPEWSCIVPGGSLWFHTWRRVKIEGTGVRSFAVDESGTIRFTIIPTSIPVTREQVAHWDPL